MTAVPPLRRAFVDTSAYFAIANSRDRSHALATTVLERLVEQRARLFTTNFIVAETHALALRRLGRREAARVLDDIDKSTIVVRVSASDERRAREIIRQYDDNDFSLIDAMSFAVMERLGIPIAFTFDRDFAQYGFQVLQP